MTITEELDNIFYDMKPVLPDDNVYDETMELSAGDKLLSQDEEIWRVVQAHRAEEYEREQRREEAHEVMKSLDEAARVTDQTWFSLRDRLTRGTAGRQGMLDGIADNLSDPGQTNDQRRAEAVARLDRKLAESRAGDDAWLAERNAALAEGKGY